MEISANALPAAPASVETRRIRNEKMSDLPINFI